MAWPFLLIITNYIIFLTAYTRRVITHSAFKNIDYKGCERLMDGMDQGEVIIRPSSKVLTVRVAITNN